MNDRQERCAGCQQMKSWCELDGYGKCRACVEAKRAQSGLKSDFGPEADAAIDAACALFPDTFGLRGHDGTFRVSRRASYVSQGVVMLYTQRRSTYESSELTPFHGRPIAVTREDWSDFCKGTVAELTAQVKK